MKANSYPRSKEILRELTLSSGAPGFENPVAQIVRRLIGEVGTVTRDRLGSVLVERSGTMMRGSKNGPRIMLAAHMDEVAFMVKGVHDSGLVRFVPLGGWWTHTLLSQKVRILTEEGPVPGVIAAVPPHHLNPSDREKVLPIKNLAIDVGSVSGLQTSSMGIEPGQAIVPLVEWMEMAAPGIICTKALDDRAGVGMMVQVMRNLGKHPNTVIAAATVQEEVGIRGAKTAVSLAKPDLAIILEGPPADDFPGCAEFVQCALGKGPQLRAMDPSCIAHPGLFRFAKSRAQALKIPFQLAVREVGGTDAGAIHVAHGGVPSVVIGVPIRYAHSHHGLMSLQDFDNAVALVIDLVSHLDSRTLKSLE